MLAKSKPRNTNRNRTFLMFALAALAAALMVPAAATAAPVSTSDAAHQAFSKQQAAHKKRVAAAKRAAAAKRRAAALKKKGYITRAEALKRGKVWVRKRVQYSQSRSYQGYRTDCSGFVSMSWKAKTSYTTRSLPSVSKRIAKSQLKPGDAVLTPGHVVMFVKWKNKRAGTFVAYEQANSAKDCVQSVKSIHRSGAKAIRYKKIIG